MGKSPKALSARLRKRVSNHRQTLIEFVLRSAVSEPPKTRAAIYRALAEYIGDKGQADELNIIADELEAADRRCREFTFHFKEGSEPKTKGK